MRNKSIRVSKKLLEFISQWVEKPLRPVLRTAKMLMPHFVALSVIVIILEWIPWRFICETSSESSSVAFELQAVGEQALNSFVTSIDCRELRLWAPSIQLGYKDPIILNAVGAQSWILFKPGDTSPIIIRDVTALPGTDIILDMEGDQLTIRFYNPKGGGASAAVEIPAAPSKILANEWLQVGASSDLVKQRDLTDRGEGVTQVNGLTMLRLTVMPEAFSKKSLFARFIRVRKLRFNQNTRNEWQPVTKGEARFRGAGDIRVQLDGGHVAIQNDAEAILTNVILSSSSIHAEATASISSLLVGKAPSLVAQMCPSLLDSILKTKLVALSVLFGGWLVGAIGGSAKLLEGLAKSEGPPKPPP